MTREEARDQIVILMADEHEVINDRDRQALDMAIKALSQEPCEDIAQELYKDLCEYFGDAKDILKSREDFKAWLERVKWHIRKAEELYEKYEYKKEPCDDAISRDAVLEAVSEGCQELRGVYGRCEELINALPPVTQKSGKWIWSDEIDRYVCDKCGQSDGKDKEMVESGEYPLSNYCHNCGAKMESEE